MTVFKRKILRLIAMIFMHLNTKELLAMFFVLSGKAWVYGLWADIVRSVIRWVNATKWFFFYLCKHIFSNKKLYMYLFYQNNCKLHIMVSFIVGLTQECEVFLRKWHASVHVHACHTKHQHAFLLKSKNSTASASTFHLCISLTKKKTKLRASRLYTTLSG